MTETETEKVWLVEVWTYQGRRWLQGKLWHQFADDAGKLLHFGKAPKLGVVGGLYEVETNGPSARIQGAKYLRSVDDAERAPWALDDRAAYIASSAAATRKRMAKDSSDFGSMTLREVRSYLMETRGGYSSTLAAVLTYLGRES